MAERRGHGFDTWLPASMSETYAGVIPRPDNQPVLGEARTLATYSQYKRFETSAKIVQP